MNINSNLKGFITSNTKTEGSITSNTKTEGSISSKVKIEGTISSRVKIAGKVAIGNYSANDYADSLSKLVTGSVDADGNFIIMFDEQFWAAE